MKSNTYFLNGLKDEKQKVLFIENHRTKLCFLFIGLIFLTFSSLYNIKNAQRKLSMEIVSAIQLLPSIKYNAQMSKAPSKDEELSYLQSLLKPEANIKNILGERYYESLNYLHNIKNVDFDWTSALPISSPPISVRKAGAKSFLFDTLQHYSRYNGHLDLRQAIKEKFEREGLKVKEENIVVHTSVFEILESLYSILNWTSNDSILIPTPTFGYYASQAGNHQIKVNFLKTIQAEGWKVQPNHLDEILTQTKAKIFLFTNPVNPTGVVYTKEELEKLAYVLKKHRTLVISDEVFKDVLLDDSQKPFSIGAIENIKDFVLTLNGPGKSMGLAGLRISYAHIPDWLIERLPKPLCGLSKPSELAAIQALRSTEENRAYLENNIREYKKRLNLVKDFVNIIDQQLHKKFSLQSYLPGSFARIYIEPKATNVVLLSFPGLKGKSFDTKKINTGLELALYLSKYAGVALVPGEASFIEGEEMVLRLPLAAQNLSKGFEKIKLVLLKLIK